MVPVVGSRLAIASVRPRSVNHRASSVAAMSPGTISGAAGYSSISPVTGSMLPTPGSRPCSVNHSLPSAPAVMSAGALLSVRPVENP